MPVLFSHIYASPFPQVLIISIKSCGVEWMNSFMIQFSRDLLEWSISLRLGESGKQNCLRCNQKIEEQSSQSFISLLRMWAFAVLWPWDGSVYLEEAVGLGCHSASIWTALCLRSVWNTPVPSCWRCKPHGALAAHPTTCSSSRSGRKVLLFCCSDTRGSFGLEYANW